MVEEVKIYMLTCEDASHLGGPMGTEYTTTMWNKLFNSVELAKKHAEDFTKQKGDWSREEGYWSWDAGAYIFIIRKVKFEE